MRLGISLFRCSLTPLSVLWWSEWKFPHNDDGFCHNLNWNELTRRRRDAMERIINHRWWKWHRWCCGGKRNGAEQPRHINKKFNFLSKLWMENWEEEEKLFFLDFAVSCRRCRALGTVGLVGGWKHRKYIKLPRRCWWCCDRDWFDVV